jgi:predicted DNA-binding transcriptional regulator AlpA
MTQLVTTNWFDETPDSAFLRERQLVGDPRDPNSRKLVPISRASLWRMVKSGRFPPPQKLGPNTTVWNVGLVRAWLLERKQAAANCPCIKVPTQHP